jgi:ABC-type dipeptide/oligopeptide/nickel transport system permease component
VSVPSFWLGLTLISLFSFRWGLLPAGGEVGGWRALILPSLTLGAGGAAIIARMTRSSLIDVLRQDYVRTARAKGLAPGAVYGRHALAVALPPLVVLLALALPGVVAGSVFVENVFAWPGMGRAMVQAIAARDYPVVLGATVLYAALTLTANLAADLALPRLDPRRR